MHMRTKKWARPELSVCPYFTNEAEKWRGHWQDLFPKQQPLHIELGCGKGLSTAQMAFANPDINYVVLDITSDVLGDTRRNVEKIYGDHPVSNIIIARYDLSYTHKIFSAEDRVERVIINFCNPWTQRGKHSKRRLTHPRQLMQYREIMTENAEIHFKTDDVRLFTDSLCYFNDCGFLQTYMTNDLHASGYSPNYVSEHEKKFSERGVQIKFGIFRKIPLKDTPEVVRYSLPDGFDRNMPEFEDYGAQD